MKELKMTQIKKIFDNNKEKWNISYPTWRKMVLKNYNDLIITVKNEKRTSYYVKDEKALLSKII